MRLECSQNQRLSLSLDGQPSSWWRKTGMDVLPGTSIPPNTTELELPELYTVYHHLTQWCPTTTWGTTQTQVFFDGMMALILITLAYWSYSVKLRCNKIHNNADTGLTLSIGQSLCLTLLLPLGQSLSFKTNTKWVILTKEQQWVYMIWFWSLTFWSLF